MPAEELLGIDESILLMEFLISSLEAENKLMERNKVTIKIFFTILGI